MDNWFGVESAWVMTTLAINVVITIVCAYGVGLAMEFYWRRKFRLKNLVPFRPWTVFAGQFLSFSGIFIVFNVHETVGQIYHIPRIIVIGLQLLTLIMFVCVSIGERLRPYAQPARQSLSEN